MIIAGSRTFTDYRILKSKLDTIFALLVQKNSKIVIISGTANGADKLGERYANENEYKLIKIPADWDKFGASAGYIRNEEMAKISNACVVFRVNNSKGSSHMIDIANKYNLQLRIYDF